MLGARAPIILKHVHIMEYRAVQTAGEGTNKVPGMPYIRTGEGYYTMKDVEGFPILSVGGSGDVAAP